MFQATLPTGRHSIMTKSSVAIMWNVFKECSRGLDENSDHKWIKKSELRRKTNGSSEKHLKDLFLWDSTISRTTPPLLLHHHLLPDSSLIHCDNLLSRTPPPQRLCLWFLPSIFLSVLTWRNVPRCNCSLRRRAMEHEIKVLLFILWMFLIKAADDLCMGSFISVKISHL